MEIKARILRICVIAGIVGFGVFIGSTLYQLRVPITEYVNPSNIRIWMTRTEATELLVQETKVKAPEAPGTPSEAPTEGIRVLTAPKVPTDSTPVDAKLRDILERLDRERIQSLLAGIQDTTISVVEHVPRPSPEDIAAYKDVVRAFLEEQFFESALEFIFRGILGFIGGLLVQLPFLKHH